MVAREESRYGRSRFSVSSEAIAETVFLLILIILGAGPVSGLLSWANTSFLAVVNRSATEFESTKNLASELVQAGEKIKSLEKKIADTELELTKLRQEAKDVNKLRALLALKESIDRTTIGADVVGRSPDNWFEQVTIDKGKKDGVPLGAAVITNQGVVGQVVKVSESTSLVRLVTDPQQTTSVTIQRINLPGVMRGNYKNPPVMEFVPVGSPVDVGDKVTCLGHGGIFPPGHEVGTVSMVRRDTNGTTLTIEIRPSENLFDLTHVLIVPPISI